MEFTKPLEGAGVFSGEFMSKKILEVKKPACLPAHRQGIESY